LDRHGVAGSRGHRVAWSVISAYGVSLWREVVDPATPRDPVTVQL